MALKKNQAKLREDVVWLFEAARGGGLDRVEHDLHETNDCGHGRMERRHCLVLSDLSYLQEHRWPGLKSVARVTCERSVKGKTSTETRYYLCGLEADAKKALQTVRAHPELETKRLCTEST